jgi:hypothetical protein
MIRVNMTEEQAEAVMVILSTAVSKQNPKRVGCTATEQAYCEALVTRLRTKLGY